MDQSDTVSSLCLHRTVPIITPKLMQKSQEMCAARNLCSPSPSHQQGYRPTPPLSIFSASFPLQPTKPGNSLPPTIPSPNCPLLAYSQFFSPSLPDHSYQYTNRSITKRHLLTPHPPSSGFFLCSSFLWSKLYLWLAVWTWLPHRPSTLVLSSIVRMIFMLSCQGPWPASHCQNRWHLCINLPSDHSAVLG